MKTVIIYIFLLIVGSNLYAQNTIEDIFKQEPILAFNNKEWKKVISELHDRSVNTKDSFLSIPSYILIPAREGDKVVYRFLPDTNNILAFNKKADFVVLKSRNLISKEFNYSWLDMDNYILGNNVIARSLRYAGIYTDKIFAIRLLNDCIFPFCEFAVAYLYEGKIYYTVGQQESNDKISIEEINSSKKTEKQFVCLEINDIVNNYYENEMNYWRKRGDK